MARDLNRRDFMGAAAATMLGLPALQGTESGNENKGSRHPNIIFIMADDLGVADLSYSRQQPKILTPNIDRLAAQGRRFNQCYAGAAVCAPCRSVLMTGQHTGHTTVRGNHGKNAPKHDGQEGRIPLKAGDITVASLLKQAGYATCMTGKWGLGEPGSTGLPNDHGFDERFGYLNQDHAPDYFTDYLWHNRERQTIKENLDGKRGAYSCDLFTDFALEFIRKNKDNPFFLYYPTTIPHAKLEVPDLGDYADKPWPEEAKMYAAMVTRMDSHVGRIMDLLDELHLADDTIVFFTSDNGAANRWEGLFNSCGMLRDKRGSVYEGGIRVPMIVSWPGKVAANSGAVWYFADFLPTAAALAGVSPPEHIDGKNVLPMLLGKKTLLHERFLYWEHHSGGKFHQAVRRSYWKGVRHGLDQPLELYNLESDSFERQDISEKHPEIVSFFEDYLKTARVPSPHWPVNGE
jgi:arylsulfatase A-like enzyme